MNVLVNESARFTDTITGSIGKIVNPKSLTLQRIDFYPGCLSKSDPSVEDFEGQVPYDTTAQEFKIDFVGKIYPTLEI